MKRTTKSVCLARPLARKVFYKKGTGFTAIPVGNFGKVRPLKKRALRYTLLKKEPARSSCKKARQTCRAFYVSSILFPPFEAHRFETIHISFRL